VEQWRELPGFDGRYQVSDHGQVRKVTHYVIVHTVWARNGITRRRVPEITLSQEVTRKGYRVVLLNKDGTRRMLHVDRLVLYAFVGTSGGSYPFHKDGNILNNRLGNLEWKENPNAIPKEYRLLPPKKSHRYKKKLTEAEVVKAFTDMRPNKTVADELKISPLCVELIKQRVIWTHFTDGLTRGKREFVPQNGLL